MENASVGPADLTFAVEYQERFGAANPTLKGSGELSVRAGEPRFQFSGKTRATFGRDTTLEFRSDEIVNLTLEGRRIHFSTLAGETSKRGSAFIFYCATPAVAVEIAELFPVAHDLDFLARQSFAENFSQLPAASSPWTSVTNRIIAVNVVAFVVMGCFGAGWVQTASMRPYLLYVANNAAATTDGEWWRIVTSLFVHYGLVHLLFNMWALFQAGHFVERLLGRSLYLLAYFGSGVTASFVSLFWHGDKVWSAGASGAVFGVYGMLLGFMLRENQAIPKPVLRPMVRSTLMFAGYNLVYGMVLPQIDNAAHLGGLVGGVAFGWLVALPIDHAARTRLWNNRLRSALAVLLIGSAISMSLAPRYDYRIREELAWDDALRDPVAREPDILKQQTQIFEDFSASNDAAVLTRWLEAEAIPFYSQWLQEVSALTLTREKQTELRRNKMAAVLSAKLENYRQLIVSLRADDPRASELYQEAEDKVLEQNQLSSP